MAGKILIADDHASVRRGLRALLEQGGEYKICCEANDGAEAVRLAKNCKHDIIIIDLLMPNLNGFRTAQEIRKVAPGVPIVFHTLYSGSRVEQEAKKFGVTAVVSKLGSPPLKEVIRALLRTGGPDGILLAD